MQCRRDRNVQPRQVVGSLFPSDLSKATAGCLQCRMRGMKSFHSKVTVCLADGEGAIRNAWARLLETCLDFNFCLIAQHLHMSWPSASPKPRTSRLRIRARVASQRKGARGKADMPAIFANYRWLRCTKNWRKVRCFRMQHHRIVQIQWHVMSDVASSSWPMCFVQVFLACPMGNETVASHYLWKRWLFTVSSSYWHASNESTYQLIVL